MTFTNSILAGLTLIREAIRSEGFVSGSNGWEIRRDGDAEFNGATFRGTIEAIGTGLNRIRVIVQTGIPTIEFRNSDGELFYVDIDDDAFRMRWATAGNSGLFFARDEGGEHGIVLRSGTTGAPSVLFDDSDGYLKRGSYSPWTVEDWHEIGSTGEPSFQNSFTNTGASWETAAFKKNVLGRVEFKGAPFRTGATPNGTTMFTLPVGYRPPNDVGFAVSSLNTQAAWVWVRSSGAVQLTGQSAAPGNTAVAMDGGSFSLI